MERQLAFISSRKLSMIKLLMVLIHAMNVLIPISTSLRRKMNQKRDSKFAMEKERHLWYALNLMVSLEKEKPMLT